VISVGALTPILVCFHKLEITPPSNFNHSRDGTHFRVEGDKFITTVDGAWNEVFKSHEQVRIFKLEGDTLTIRVPEQPSGLQPGKRNTSVLTFEREK
jgi:hypothetical protein